MSGGGFCGGSDGGFVVGFLLWFMVVVLVRRGAWVTNLGFVCVMGFGCYNGGVVTCGGGGCGGLWLL